MSFLRGECTPICSRDGGSSCWHKNTIIRRQLLTGKWMLENKKGYIRLADEHMIIFDEEEYDITQIVWDLQVAYTNLEQVLEGNDNYLAGPNRDTQLSETRKTLENWGGNTPKDNLIIGSDFSLSSITK